MRIKDGIFCFAHGVIMDGIQYFNHGGYRLLRHKIGALRELGNCLVGDYNWKQRSAWIGPLISSLSRCQNNRCPALSFGHFKYFFLHRSCLSNSDTFCSGMSFNNTRIRTSRLSLKNLILAISISWWHQLLSTKFGDKTKMVLRLCWIFSSILSIMECPGIASLLLINNRNGSWSSSMFGCKLSITQAVSSADSSL